MFQLVTKLKTVKMILGVWKMSIFRDVNKQIQQALNDVDNAQLEISVKGFSEDQLNVEVKAQKKLDDLLKRQDFIKR